MAPLSADEARRQQLRAQYVARINRVIDYVQAHVDEDLTLERLAKVAHFSPFHFHRVFSAIVGETLSQFVARLRLERAASQLLAMAAKSVTEIALDAGYSSSAAFSRAFREAFETSPSEWRAAGAAGRKIGKTERKPSTPNSSCGSDSPVVSFHIDARTNQSIWRVDMKNQKTIDVVVKELPEMHVAYVRHFGAYAGQAQLFQELFGRLMQWAGPRGLIRFPETKMLSVYHDNPSVTDESRLRLDCCITVPPDAHVDGEVGKTVIPGGKYAVAHFELGQDEYSEAWGLVMGGWLPESGLEPDERPCFELYLNDPQQHPQGKSVVDICVPVRPI
jgi:AraC family transcriptional regulator